jgi:hypothetical protein
MAAVDGHALPPLVVDWEQDMSRGLLTLMPLVCAHFDGARNISIRKM